MAEEVYDELKKDPIKFAIIILQIMIVLYWFSSFSGISPITNSTITNSIGCASCSPTGGTGGAWLAAKPLLSTLFILGIPLTFAFAFEQFKHGRMRPVIEPEVEEEE